MRPMLAAILLAAPATALAQEPARKALLVGVSTYQRTGFAGRPLPFAATDMQELAAKLERGGWKVDLLVSQGATNEATRARVAAGLDRLLRDVNASDLILVALSGHGQQFRAAVETDDGVRQLDEAFFCPSDAVVGDAATMLGMSELTRLLGKKGGKNLVLVDACRDDPRKGGVRGVDGNTVRSLPTNTSILFSCAAGQQSYETNLMFGADSRRGRGVFFHSVIEGLDGKAADAAGRLTWADLTKYVADRVNDDAVRWFPERAVANADGEKIVQTPHMVGSLVGRSPQLLARAAASPAPAPMAAPGEVALASVFSDHMVLQRDQEIFVWGYGQRGAGLVVEFDGDRVPATVVGSGKWEVVLRPRPASATPKTLRVVGKNTIVVQDVLIGDVFLGSGQSNMQWALDQTPTAKAEISAASHPTLRLLTVPMLKSKTPVETFKGAWLVCEPAAAGRFSALLYHFGRELQRRNPGVPVGLVHSSWGGSTLAMWARSRNGDGENYNGMIAPLAPFAVRGILWMHGESNVGANLNLKYRDDLVELMDGWRKAWRREVPFLIGQLPPFAKYATGSQPELWEAQAAALKHPGTALVATIDLVKNVDDIHDCDKRELGRRFALAALAKCYGKPPRGLVHSGPTYKGMTVEGRYANVRFAHLGDGLASRDGQPLTEFEIAGPDGNYVPARASIKGDEVVVEAPGIENPAAVRFAWRSTAKPNLINRDGLPASPFRTRGWQGGTGE